MSLAEQIEADWNDALGERIESHWTAAIRENNRRDRNETIVGIALGFILVPVMPVLVGPAVYLMDNYGKNPTVSGAVNFVADFYKSFFL